jgi:hypothetical protein
MARRTRLRQPTRRYRFPVKVTTTEAAAWLAALKIVADDARRLRTQDDGTVVNNRPRKQDPNAREALS